MPAPAFLPVAAPTRTPTPALAARRALCTSRPRRLPSHRHSHNNRYRHDRRHDDYDDGAPKQHVVAVVDGPVQPSASIVIGAVALATPFFVAAVLFGERIFRQRACEACDGSGLVPNKRGQLRRCTACGGFLPWQSWRRFFTG